MTQSTSDKGTLRGVVENGTAKNGAAKNGTAKNGAVETRLVLQAQPRGRVLLEPFGQANVAVKAL